MYFSMWLVIFESIFPWAQILLTLTWQKFVPTFISIQMVLSEVRLLTLQVKSHIALVKDPGSIPSNQMVGSQAATSIGGIEQQTQGEPINSHR